MAVQAQYPSNILFLNRNNGQEGQQAAGLVLDQPILYNNNNGSANSRKRTREATVHSNSNVVMNNNNNHNPLIPFESQPPQLIHLSQLHNNVVSTGLRLSNSTIDQQQLLHGSQSSSSSSLLSLFSQGFASQIKQQRDEIEQFLQAQGEELRRALAEKRQRHYRALLTAAEEVVARRLREKEAEVEKATRRNAELEARAAQLAAEAQVWMAKARTQEAAAASLQAQLQQTMMASAGAATHGGDDGGAGLSCAVEGQAEDAESAYVDPDRVVMVSAAAARPKCRGCGRRVASVVVLPCRHLCICTECEAHFRACPVCLTLKNSTVEVFL
ncbi:hypothetical protein HN51_001279 [Arachis hypogaea]|uniref:RING-type domain-containing protein n=1 Tax=Arachis hypogaea TaxID=3818 RepID=A0A445ESM9_ARAHY|nr:BOI-related E3 ubiquitin-protein ligase 1 [Arachis hypogaea]QHO49349.1 E3 ubiquitin-protein ligase BOI [Arachis hypogaea]RYR78323.1 hypothetical protein Ahy_A01g003087 isoform A [Arachis hypogaea]